MQVIFRKITTGESVGEIIAAFPKWIEYQDGSMQSYMHNGQHGPCSIGFLNSDTVTSYSPIDKHGDLMIELKNIGYIDLEEVFEFEGVPRKHDPIGEAPDDILDDKITIKKRESAEVEAGNDSQSISP